MVGDVMFDAAIFFGAKAETSSRILQKIGINTKSYILATIHRAENTDDKQRLVSILEGFHKTDQTIVWPLHPRTKARLNAYCLTIPKNIIQIEPVGYLDMVMLEKNAICIATDSGGVQKEAFFYQVPCVTLRDETEWVELVDSGWNQIASPSNTDRMVEILLNSLNKKGENVFPYGKGDAAKKIIYNLNKQY
jgi:UDP-GlcNAc3NAcA epimerase